MSRPDPRSKTLSIVDAEKVRDEIESSLTLHMPPPRPGEFKHKFTSAEDALLCSIVEEIGTVDWTIVARRMSPFTTRQCRERWTNYLHPTIGNTQWTPAEDQFLEMKYAEIGPNWRAIAALFPTRSKNNVKNRWNRLQRIKGRFEEPHQAAANAEDASGVAAARDSIWSQILFEGPPDSAAWDAVFGDFPS
jgi:hypothetical protein